MQRAMVCTHEHLNSRVWPSWSCSSLPFPERSLVGGLPFVAESLASVTGGLPCHARPVLCHRKPPPCHGKPSPGHGRRRLWHRRIPLWHGKPSLCHERPPLCHGRPPLCHGRPSLRQDIQCSKQEIHKKKFTLLDLCMSSLRRGHANLFCIVPILRDDPRRESEV